MSYTSKNFVSTVTNKLLMMKFFGEFILIYPIITIMFGQFGHVSAAGIGIILGLGLALSVLLEIPTGIIADKVPRKYVLLFSIVCKILGLLVWLLYPYFRWYLVAAALFGLSAAFESGTLQAYLYGALGSDDKKLFGKFWSKVHAMIMISYTIAYVLTTIIGINYPWLISLSIIPCVISLMVCLSLPLDKLSASVEVKPRIFASALSHIRSTPELVKQIVSGVVIVALALIMIEYISLYYNQVGVGTRFVPILMALNTVISAALFWSLHKWESALNKYKILLLLLSSSIFIVLLWGGTLAQVAGMIVLSRLIRLLQIQYETNIQHLSNDKARATISSIGSFISYTIAAIGLTLIGLSATHDNIVKPMRIVLLSGVAAYILVQLFIKRRDAHSI